MDNIGAEVGQKMRSAVKAKLMELGCYVDDELPDYIMVMVANKRTKSQMNHDLELFLNTKTTTFVDWLHVVLKKLEEITITNPLVLKKVSKRKSSGILKGKVKKEKKEKTGKKPKKKEVLTTNVNIKEETAAYKSLTDDLPVKANKLSEVRKIVIMKEGSNDATNEENVVDDNFDIPTLAEVSNETELADIEKKIKGVKSRLGIQVASGSEDEDYINLKVDPGDLLTSDATTKQKKLKEEILRKISMLDDSNSDEQRNKNEHPRIIFGNECSGSPTKKISVLERLGKRRDTTKAENLKTEVKRKRVNLTEVRREEEQFLGVDRISDTENSSLNDHEKISEKDGKRLAIGESPRESALKRLGVMSKIAIPQKDSNIVNSNTSEEDTEEIPNKDVPSTVKVKPRALLPSSKQANKNLLLKAVAEAQRSIAQTPVIGKNKLDAIYTKKYREKTNNTKPSTCKLSIKDKNNLRNILVNAVKQDKKELEFSSDDDNLEYIPKPIKQTSKSNNHPEYVPSSRDHSSDDCDNPLDVNNLDVGTNCGGPLPKQTKNQTFVITLDGISRNHDVKNTEPQRHIEGSQSRKRKQPSPIIFDFQSSPTRSKSKVIPDKLTPITPPSSIKAKERCRFWPTCRQGDKCEFIHPSTSCRAFPQCKFGDKCLYVHPPCKFESSCTRKECPYDHTIKTFNSAKMPQMCKFYPSCSNIHCSFYHPKPCKYGKHCKNPLKCSFSHTFPTKSSLTWRSTITS